MEASLPSRRRDWLHLGLLFLGGFDLRVTILAIPPVIPAIHHDLRLDEKSVAALGSLPVLLLALFAVPGSLLIARLGPRRALLSGLVLMAAAGALRGIGPAQFVLFSMTILMGVAVAVTQPTFPSLVRDWFPARIGLATGVYALGLLVGESVPASLTIPLVLPLTGNSWELSLAFWSLPVVAGAALLLAFTRQSRPQVDLPPTRWWPDWRSLRTWQIGLIMGCASAIYFGLNAFLPDFLRATGRASLTGAGLAALNTFQIPASLLMAVLAHRLIGRRGPFIVTGALNLGGLLGLVLAPGYWPVVFAGVIGFSTALPLVLTLSLPPLLSAPGDVHRLSAAIFTIQYMLAFLAPLAAGAVWDATGSAVVGVGLLAAIALLMSLLAVTLRLPRLQRVPAQAHL